MSRVLLRGVLVLFLTGLLAACDSLPFGFTEIGEIREHPAAFEGEEVRIRGEVTEVTRVPFLETLIFTVRDETGEIAVFAAAELPSRGTKVALRGTVRSAATIGGTSFGVRVKETVRLPRYLAW